MTLRIAQDQRLASLDAFRGFTIAAMLLVNNPGSWGHIYPQLAHAQWHGWTFTDWIFPFFLFISGMSMVIACDLKRGKTSDGALLRHLIRRAVTIILIGVLLNGFPFFDWSNWRIPGVLQRIGLCALLAAPLVVYTTWRTQLIVALAACVVYTLGMQHIAVPGPDGVVATGSLEPGRDFGAYVDRLLLDGHLWAKVKTWDPEGLWSTLPALASFLFGALAGRWLRDSDKARTESTVWMLLAGAAALWVGAALGSVSIPINKQLWSPAYAVFMSGWALWVFGAFYWLMDAQPNATWRERSRRWLQPLVVYGMNALFLFVLAGVIGRLLNVIKLSSETGPVSLKSWLYAPLSALPIDPVNASLLFAVCFVFVFWAIALLMWRNRWFVKV
jgi:predicted acyltransferase